MATTDIVQATATEARALTDQIKVAVDGTWQLIKHAYLSRAWDALGYSSWDDYCTREFGTSRLRLPREERQEVVSSMREIGMSTRAIAAATGTAQDTVRRALASGERNRSPEPTEFYEDDEPTEDVRRMFDQGEKGVTRDPERVTGTDGKSYAAQPAKPTRQPRTDVVATVNRALLRAQEAARSADEITRQHLDGRHEEAVAWSRSLSASMTSLELLLNNLTEVQQ